MLEIKLCKVVAQMKLRMYKAACEEIEALGNFEDKAFLFETYPDLYPLNLRLKGSMVPFTFRIIKAVLPYLLKSTSTSTTTVAQPVTNVPPTATNPPTTPLPTPAVATVNTQANNLTTSSSTPATSSFFYLDPLYELLAVCRTEIAYLTNLYPNIASRLTNENSKELSKKVISTSLNYLLQFPSNSSLLDISSTSESNSASNNKELCMSFIPYSSSPSFPYSQGNSYISHSRTPSETTFVPSHSRNASASDTNEIPTASVEQNLEDQIIENRIKIWKSRENKVKYTIISRLIQERAFPAAIQMMNEITTKNPTDPYALSILGRLFLQLGNIKTTSAIFKQVESLIKDPLNNVVTRMNNGYLSLAMEQYTTAIDHFQAALEIDPSYIPAANNKAVCLLYTSDLSRAITTLEDIIKRNPENNLNEPIVFNLCTLYDLKSDNSIEKKKQLMAIAAKYASDSFDFSVLKLQ